jgi:hypothetical protein
MTWDQVLVWLILPAISTISVGGGAVWLSRYIPKWCGWQRENSPTRDKRIYRAFSNCGGAVKP